MAHIQICICVIVINRLCYNAIVQMGFARIPLSTRVVLFSLCGSNANRSSERENGHRRRWRRPTHEAAAAAALKPSAASLPAPPPDSRARCRPTAAFPPYAPPHSFPNRAGAAASPRPASIPLGRLLNSRWRRRILSPSRIIIIPQPSSDFFERSTLRIIIIRL
uniref:Uncharacterized protein n=1 Tax=Oryza sativa subsp. japonica TaxID=39947 RepID=Q5VPS7_ORYSJ|nr:hypothetical protein [Oryza sativa Japonica Group]